MSFSPPRCLRTGLFTLLMLTAPGGVALAAQTVETPLAPGVTTPAQALATPIIAANDVAAVAEIARGYGEAEETTAQNGDPVIVGQMNGIGYQLFFLECAANRDCKVLDFYAIWDTPGVELAVINDWNRMQPFNKAYLGEDGLPVIELNLSLVGGLTRPQLVDAFDRWAVALAEFQRTVVEGAL
ncbi:YbjN domain-containing protein [Aurantimonas aggregata]|uniref:YbjN domain-containing protein n=1 Tax=Aurantimonas aggregata TaxID=2047720 RepID=A0A6L9MCZ9_9HYPH|nr:YbjN domain-containing protein [Aurantimonas aggregata]NDV85531.1 YbjN domain-containing protein [Aurantimonas aggregata]